MLCSLTYDTELVKDRSSPPLEQMFLIYSEILKEVMYAIIESSHRVSA